MKGEGGGEGGVIGNQCSPSTRPFYNCLLFYIQHEMSLPLTLAQMVEHSLWHTVWDVMVTVLDLRQDPHEGRDIIGTVQWHILSFPGMIEVLYFIDQLFGKVGGKCSSFRMAENFKK